MNYRVVCFSYYGAILSSPCNLVNIAAADVGAVLDLLAAN